MAEKDGFGPEASEKFAPVLVDPGWTFDERIAMLKSRKGPTKSQKDEDAKSDA